MVSVDGAVSCMVSFQCRSRRPPSTTNRFVSYQNPLVWLTVEPADLVSDAAADPTESVWLRANRRLVGLVGAAAAGLLVAAAVAGLAAVRGSGGWAVAYGVLAVGIGVSAASVAAVAWRAAHPRLRRQGGDLLVQLGPTAVERLPLAAVEVFFLGSQRLDRGGSPARSDEPAFRVGTLVVRVAERAVNEHGWQGGGPWAAWEDGYLVVDGRRTEPLAVETLRRVNGRLAKAKRQPVAEGCRPVSAGGCGV